jgi:hypothetical protein
MRIPAKPASAEIQRARVGRSPRTGLGHQEGEHRREEADGRAFGERQEAQRPEETGGGDYQAERARELDSQVARAPEPGAAALPGDRRGDQHLSGVPGPHHQEERVLLHEVFRRGVQGGKANSGQEEERDGAAQRVVALHGRHDTGRRGRYRRIPTRGYAQRRHRRAPPAPTLGLSSARLSMDSPYPMLREATTEGHVVLAVRAYLARLPALALAAFPAGSARAVHSGDDVAELALALARERSGRFASPWASATLEPVETFLSRACVRLAQIESRGRVTPRSRSPART